MSPRYERLEGASARGVSRALVLLNVAPTEALVTLPSGPWRLGASTHERDDIPSPEIRLEANEGLVFVGA